VQFRRYDRGQTTHTQTRSSITILRCFPIGGGVTSQCCHAEFQTVGAETRKTRKLKASFVRFGECSGKRLGRRTDGETDHQRRHRGQSGHLPPAHRPVVSFRPVQSSSQMYDICPLWLDCLIWLCLYIVIYICISMGGQLDGNFLPDSLPHKFILIVTLIICFVVNKFLSLFLPVTSPPNARWSR